MFDVTRELVSAALILAVTLIVYGLLFNRETTLSYSLGYNLYGAERVLEGEVPYRDFHTLYPPATVYVNAALFKLFGTSLYVALLGVFIFKSLTTLGLYLCARRLMPAGWAAAAALSTLVWLRPNGPFKAVPMHYGALFLSFSLLLLLAYAKRQRVAYIFGAGVSLALVALFKHNIGAYALLGSLAMVLLEPGRMRFGISPKAGGFKRALALLSGFALPIIPVLAYIEAQGALAPMIRSLLFGPGEFLLSRLAATPSPLIPGAGLVILACCALLARGLRGRGRALPALFSSGLVALSAFALLANQAAIDKIIFYAPVFVLLGWLAAIVFRGFRDKAAGPGRLDGFDSGELIAVGTAAAAAFMESFPRFAREQAIGAMPFVILLLVYLLYSCRGALAKYLGDIRSARLAVVILPLALFLMGARLFSSIYFENGLRLRSPSMLTIERGRGVYFPEEKAREITGVVDYIQARVPGDGYFFAQSYAGSSYLFLADRKNPSGAQFWGGVGVSDAERAQTLASLDARRVGLIVTSEKDLAAETYGPMRDFINENFKSRRSFGEVLVLER
ncbi:MAG TPA: glycosyltransferase family 39 protein [Blastocatellia bacterium]|jgi:hypothetical protein|nr:glycosyltransferase family 39 protein [Blastocatellia bacterium]